MIEPEEFRASVREAAALCARDLPWRRTIDPYAILVSEFMCQQTQVGRVVPKYLAWMERFPEPASVAQAEVSEILALWSGLGYNRRALALAESCSLISSAWSGGIPADENALLQLPGVGPYTARAVLVFAFNQPSVLIETNIRTVYIKHFFPGADAVSDREILKIAERCLDTRDSRAWHNALMDYGAEIKRVEGNHSRRALAYQPQTSFSTSFRRVRGAVLKALVGTGQADVEALYAALPFSRENLEKAIDALVAEGFAIRYGSRVRLGTRGDE